ncbi:MAG: hypothetical protein IJ568_04290 [Bacilli bacterium]|nr:hypothetical protein [Bacilli bacterium]
MNENIRDFEIHGITGYTVMSNYHLRDPNLSFKAKGLLSMMLSMPKDWDYSISGLEKISNEGKYAVRSTLEELKKAQYVNISRFRDEKGLFRYKYTVYYLPYPMWLKMHNYPDINFPYMDNPNMDNCTQIKNNNKKDKIDKTPDETGEEIKHNIFTKELIKRNYISEDDSSSFLFDQLFEDLLKQGNNYKDLLIMTNYVVSRIKERNFRDENDNEIKNKYGYFKNALIGNIRRFENLEHLYEDDEFNWLDDDSKYDWLNDNEEDYEL